MLLLPLLLATLATPTELQAPLPPEPACTCTVSTRHSPCGFDHESCLCDKEYGWRIYRLYDEESGICEEYRITLPSSAQSH